MKRQSPKRPAQYCHSTACRIQAREAIQYYNATRHLRPKCEAKRRTDGEPCQQVAMANGRCVYHGGKTPSGKNWHRPQPAGTPDKTERKIRDRGRIEKKRAQRIAQMTVEDRERYDAWHRARQPGPPSTRAARRRRIAQAQDIRDLLMSSSTEHSTDSEAATLAGEIEDLKREVIRLREAMLLKSGVFE